MIIRDNLDIYKVLERVHLCAAFVGGQTVVNKNTICIHRDTSCHGIDRHSGIINLFSTDIYIDYDSVTPAVRFLRTLAPRSVICHTCIGRYISV